MPRGLGTLEAVGIEQTKKVRAGLHWVAGLCPFSPGPAHRVSLRQPRKVPLLPHREKGRKPRDYEGLAGGIQTRVLGFHRVLLGLHLWGPLWRPRRCRGARAAVARVGPKEPVSHPQNPRCRETAHEPRALANFWRFLCSEKHLVGALAAAAAAPDKLRGSLGALVTKGYVLPTLSRSSLI